MTKHHTTPVPSITFGDLEQAAAAALYGGPDPIMLPAHKTPMPKAAGIEDVGRLSAAAVRTQYERAAKAVTQMGDVVSERIVRLEAAMKECDEDMRLIAEASAAIAEKGNLVAAEIEHANSVAADVRIACLDFHKRIGGKPNV